MGACLILDAVPGKDLISIKGALGSGPRHRRGL